MDGINKCWNGYPHQIPGVLRKTKGGNKTTLDDLNNKKVHSLSTNAARMNLQNYSNLVLVCQDHTFCIDYLPIHN
jgi:hypothetical protein